MYYIVFKILQINLTNLFYLEIFTGVNTIFVVNSSSTITMKPRTVIKIVKMQR